MDNFKKSYDKSGEIEENKYVVENSNEAQENEDSVENYERCILTNSFDDKSSDSTN